MNLRQVKSRINFTNKKTVLVVAQGSTFTVWASTLYNQNEFTSSISSKLTLKNKVSNYQFQITANIKGMSTLHLLVTSKSNQKIIRSNYLTVYVI